jgi:putative heme-binding domain-containing protein
MKLECTPDSRERCILPAIMRVSYYPIALFAAVSAVQAQSNPFDTVQDAAQGAALFQTHCSYCHGARGEGGRGADLTTGQYRHGSSDASLFKNVRNGIPGTEMPVVRATDEEVWKMVAFVKKLGAASGEKAAGDPAAGKALFEGKGRCTSCHSIGREGGTLGPDLSDVGRRRDLRYLEESLVSPDADVPLRYRAVRVTSKSGQTITGIRLNEDDVSIQLRDENGDLRSFLKEDAREIKYDKPSLMPAYGSSLSKEFSLSKKEIGDVVAYLSGLRGMQ